MEQLDYLIRTLTYKRSCLELALKKRKSFGLGDSDTVTNHLQGKIDGLNFALTELYKMAGIMAKESGGKLKEAMDTIKALTKKSDYEKN